MPEALHPYPLSCQRHCICAHCHARGTASVPIVLTLPCQRHCIHAHCPNTPMPSRNISSGKNHTHKQLLKALKYSFAHVSCHSSQEWPMPLLNWQDSLYWQKNLMSEGRFHHFLLQKGPQRLAQITGRMVGYIPKGRTHCCRVTSVLSSDASFGSMCADIAF